MDQLTRKWLSLLLVVLLVLQTTATVSAGPQVVASPSQTEPQVVMEEQRATAEFTSPPPLEEVAKMPTLEVATLALKFNYNLSQIQSQIQALKNQSKAREQSYSQQAKAAQQEIQAKEKALSKLPTTLSDPKVVAQRQQIQCEILETKTRITDQALAFLQEQISRDVQMSHLSLLGHWRGEHQQIAAQIAAGTSSQRQFGNVLDIGNRGSQKPFADQQKDVALGQRELEDARRSGRMPKEIKDPAVQQFVNQVAERIARNSDLQVPLHVYVVQQEVRKDGRPVLGQDGQPEQVTNAMALPGGFLLVYAGLIMAARNESELAGVMAHEIGHGTARHSARLMKKGTTYGILQWATLIALTLFAPGLFQAGSYLAYQLKGLLLQSIFNGLGLVFTLDALGVSRDSEMEADQLGMQYAWKAGYDPEGIITFFDAMASKSGYASRTSFFATHPAFGERTLGALKEDTILTAIDPNRKYIADTQRFEQIKGQLARELHKTRAEIQEEEKSRPTLEMRGNVNPEACAEILVKRRPASGESVTPPQP